MLKRISALAIIICMLIPLAACKGKENGDVPVVPPDSGDTVVEGDTPTVPPDDGDTVVEGDVGDDNIVEPAYTITTEDIIGEWEVAGGGFFVRFAEGGTWDDDDSVTGAWVITDAVTVELTVAEEYNDDRVVAFTAEQEDGVWYMTFEGESVLRKVQ